LSSDGLAKVTYLFGATAPAEPSEAPSVDRAQSRSDRAEPRSPDTDGWYVEPGNISEPTGDRAPLVDRAALGDRAEPRSEPALAPAPAPKSNLRHLPNFIENPDVPEVVIPANTGETKSERRASNVSLNALARRGMSSREMEQLLERRELEPEDIESEIARLEGAGLLDDVQLAENLMRTLHERKGLGKSAIAAEMRRRKVDDSAIAAALETLDADDELERAIEVAVKRAGQLRSYDQETAKRRLSAYLQRRGYGGSVLSAAMKAALDGAGSGSGPRFS